MGEKYNGTQRKTNYNDFWYDSQQEAQWGVIWDDTGISFTPHPATFKTGKYYNGEEICYTPDFYLRDYNIFCEVKPSDRHLADLNIQRKISAAMDGNYTPVGHGLMILGPLKDFSKNNTQKYWLSGEFYEWVGGAIAKSYWEIGESHTGEVETRISFAPPDSSKGDTYSHYPYLGKNPSVYLERSGTRPTASEVVYRAIFNAIYADKNNLFTFEQKNADSLKEINDSWVNVPAVGDDLPW